MFLHELEGKNIFTAKKICGICKGIGVRVKSGQIKYLFCENAQSLFFLPVSTVKDVKEGGIVCKRFTPVFPQNAGIITLQKPVYSTEGKSLGAIKDVEWSKWSLLRIFTEGKTYSPLSLFAVDDAVIVKKKPPFPLGETLKNENVVTRATLKKSIAEGKLIRLTLSVLKKEEG